MESKSWQSALRSCSVFGKFRVQISARRPGILRFFVVIPTSTSKCKDKTAITGSASIVLSILNLDVVSFPQRLDRRGKGLRFPMDKKEGRLQCQCGSGGEEKSMLPLPRTEPQFLARLALWSAAMLIELLIYYISSAINEYQYYRKMHILKVCIRNLCSIVVHLSTRVQNDMHVLNLAILLYRGYRRTFYCYYQFSASISKRLQNGNSNYRLISGSLLRIWQSWS
jgi:hypothetical protein